MTKNIYHRRRPARRWTEIAAYAGVAAGFVILLAVCWFEFIAPDPGPAPIAEGSLADVMPESDPGLAEHTLPDQALLEQQQQALAEEAEANPPFVNGEIAQGDTAGALLQQWLNATETHNLVEACKNVYSLARVRVGQPYVAHLEDGVLHRFEYEIDNDKRLLVARTTGEDGKSFWEAKVEEIEYEIKLVKIEGAIDSSMYQSMADIGENAALAVRLAEVFAWEVNFIRDIQPGDSFRLLVEKRYRDGEFKGYGKMPAAEFVNKGSKYEAFLHQDGFGNSAYFNAAGDSLKRAFLKAPLSFSRISSRFNLKRVHPIFKTTRPHPAVDYAAPKGTPVKAIGSGVVTFRGYGKGAGNYIVLKHSNGYESMYLHLNGFASHLKKGGKVRQGEVIGYVGSTGYSTGPHLDFRMKQNGKYLNPEKVLSPRDESIPKAQLAEFKGERDVWRRYLDDTVALNAYNDAASEKEN